ncbi:hypothetical protein [Robbsia sp. KACC 23696]
MTQVTAMAAMAAEGAARIGGPRSTQAMPIFLGLLEWWPARIVVRPCL